MRFLLTPWGEGAYYCLLKSRFSPQPLAFVDGVRMEPRLFSWCLIVIDGYRLKVVSVLLRCLVPSPLATESWVSLRAFFVYAQWCFCVGSFSATQPGIYKVHYSPLSVALLSVVSDTHFQPQFMNIQ